MSDTPDFARLEAFALELAAAAGAAALPLFRTGLDTDNKLAHLSRFDPVTEADKGAERAIRALINRHFPDHGIIGEEYGEENTDAEFVWVLDPVDGTRAFISGLPLWTTLIGLRHRGRPVLGVIAQPYLQEVFLGSPLGSRLITPRGDVPLRVRGCVGLHDAVIGTTDPNLFPGIEGEAYGSLLKAVKLARYGCDAYAFAMVAMGTMDIALETGLKPWDIEAIIPVIENAGGVVTDWRGEPVPDTAGQVIAGSSRELVEAALEHLKGAAST
ncbi:Histidinol-phosphate phosphatase [Asticcacaulis biprosthecium C19]|uniref:Histidinol-phosphatase n=1 Tax=Asticcacaulis biprosthecium C19 TaxID=715226 RepID=F4QP81_9CAUL|nr:histidinol-phosphatase [Asticcacaulis biprosthecium]EGF91139.1 Histidinol-phosphate phosphatase [Asticcacaulis biprosthecium C19]